MTTVHLRILCVAVLAAAFPALAQQPATQPPVTQPPVGSPQAEVAQTPLDWKALEAPFLTNHTQLTFPDRFVKAGEAYFSPDGNWIIFQAIEQPKADAPADPFYTMYVARLNRNAGSVSLESITRVSPTAAPTPAGGLILTTNRPSSSGPPSFALLMIRSRASKWAHASTSGSSRRKWRSSPSRRS